MQPASVLPAIEYAARSDPGRDPEKQVNEDACVARETRFGHLCLVCDGMGGHASGREAAERAVTIVLDVFDQAPEEMAPAEVLRRALEEANRGVYAMGSGEVGSGRPGCTAVAVLLHVHGTEIAHVGDSRAYLVHEGQIFRLTRDHSVVQELVDRGLLTPAQAAHHPDANRITRALGISADVDIELRKAALHHVSGDAFILCSDGLSDLVEDGDMLSIVGGTPAAQAVGRLVDLANARGGHDNITAVVLRARESADGPQPPLSPTIPQTAILTPPPPGPVAPRTVFQSPEDASPAPSSGLAAQPTAPDPLPRTPASGRTLLAVGLTAACLAAAGLGAVLVHECSERRGKPSARTELTPALLAPVDAGADAPAALAPETVVLPPPAAPPGEPLAPLELAPSGGKKRKRPL